MAQKTGDNFYNETGQSFNNNPASLKGKLQTLEVSSTSHLATNQEHLKWTQQPQERSADSQKRKRHPRISSYYEDSRCEEKFV